MIKLRGKSHFQQLLEEDLAWRIQEISYLKREVADASEQAQRTLLRAALPLLYAHWEGYIKNAANLYGKYLSLQGLKYEKVHDRFMGLSALQQVKALGGLSKKIFVSSQLLGELIEIRNKELKIDLYGHIADIGNLDYDMFDQIVQFLGFSKQFYENRHKLIDESLVKRRNMVAHGENIGLDEDGFKKLSEEIIKLMLEFKTDIENAVSTESYIKKDSPCEVFP